MLKGDDIQVHFNGGIRLDFEGAYVYDKMETEKLIGSCLIFFNRILLN